MCVHHKLNEVPNGHLFENLRFDFIPPFASINRLVIRSEARRLGLSKKLDFVRIQTALYLGCRTIIAYCVEALGIIRVKSLERNGFQIIDSSQSLILNPYGFVTSLALSL